MTLTHEQRIQITREYTSGGNAIAIAEKHGIERSAVYYSVRACGGTVREMGAPARYSIDHSFFAKIDSHAKAQILGFIYADGCLMLNKGGPYGTLTVALSRTDDDYVVWMAAQMKSDRPVFRRVAKGPIKAALTSTFITNNRTIVRDIQALGVTPKKSMTLTFPTPDQVPSEFVGSFVRGYFEGDGCMFVGKPSAKCATKHGNASMIGSEAFIKGLNEVLCDLGIKAYLIPHTAKCGATYLNLEMHRVDDIMRFYDFIYRDAPYRMERKHAKFVEYMDQYREVQPSDGLKTKRKHVLKTRNYTEATRKKMSEFCRLKAIRQYARDRFLKDVDGRIHVFNMVTPFEELMGLRNKAVFALFNGKLQHHRGWTVPTEAQVETARATGTLIDCRTKIPDDPANTTLAPVIPISDPAIALPAA